MNQFTITKYLFIVLCITSMPMLNAGREELEEKLRTMRKRETQQALVAHNALSKELTSTPLHEIFSKLNSSLTALIQSSPTFRPFARTEHQFIFLTKYNRISKRINPTQIIDNMIQQIKKDRARLNMAALYIDILQKKENSLSEKDKDELQVKIKKLKAYEERLIKYEASIIIYKKKQKRFSNF